MDLLKHKDEDGESPRGCAVRNQCALDAESLLRCESRYFGYLVRQCWSSTCQSPWRRSLVSGSISFPQGVIQSYEDPMADCRALDAVAVDPEQIAQQQTCAVVQVPAIGRT